MNADEELLPSGPLGGGRSRDDWSKRFDQSALPEIDLVDEDESAPFEPARVAPPSSTGGLERTPEPEILEPDEGLDPPPPPPGAPLPEPELSAPELSAPEPELSIPDVDTPEEPAEEDDEEPGTDLDALVQEALAIVDRPPDPAPAPDRNEPERYLDGEQARAEMATVLDALRGALDEGDPLLDPPDDDAAPDETADPSPAKPAPPDPGPRRPSGPPAPASAVEDRPSSRSAPPEPWQRIAEDLSDVELDRALDVFERLAGKGGRIDVATVAEIAATAPPPAAARAAAARDRMLVGFPAGSDEIVLSIADIERVVGPLPAAARSSGIWWADWIARSPEGYRWRVHLDTVREQVVFRPVEESALE